MARLGMARTGSRGDAVAPMGGVTACLARLSE